jgi:ATP-dependent Clp protease ATP-binding subunit ClpB
VFNILLQVLDEGRLTDNKGRTADFRNTIIIMTSNMGSQIIQENLEKVTDTNREMILESMRHQVFDLLKKTIRPEFLNRIDEIIMFEPLTRDQIREVVRLQVKAAEEVLENGGVTLKVTGEAISWLANHGYDPQFGARPIKRLIQKMVLNELSRMILDGSLSKDSEIELQAKDGKLVFQNLAKK